MTTQDVEARRIPAAELLGNHWLDGAPLTLDEARGSVLLLLFWDYSCIHSLRVLATVRQWHRRYAECGLLVAGVHVPKFPFGRDHATVETAVHGMAPGFPVVMDNEALIASRYGIRSVPALVLVDAGGFVRFRAEQEGNEEDVEHALQALLHEAGRCEELPLPVLASRGRGFRLRGTPDLLTGYQGGSLGNVEGYSPESVVAYRDPGIYFEGRFYVAGEWLNERTAMLAAAGDGQIIADCEALQVHAVMEHPGGARAVTVRQDDAFLTEETRGEDVRIGPDGRSYCLVQEPRSYHLVRNPAHNRHVVRIDTGGPGLRVYGVTFVAGNLPDAVMNN